MMSKKTFIRKSTFLSQLMFSFVCIIFFVSLFMTSYCIYLFVENDQNRTDEYQTGLIRQVGTKIAFYAKDTQIAQYQTISALIQQDAFQYDYLKERANLIVRIENNLQSIRRSSQSVNEIAAFSMNGDLFSSSGYIGTEVWNKGWMNDFLKSTESNCILNMNESEYKNRTSIFDNPAILFLKKVYNPLNAREVVSIILVSMRYDLLQETLRSDLNEDTSMYLLSKDGHILCSTDGEFFGLDSSQAKIGDFTLDRLIIEKKLAQYHIKTYEVSNTDWMLVSILSKPSLFTDIKSITGLIVILLFAIVVSSIWAYFMSRKLIQPIFQIVRAMKEAGNGNFDKQLPEFANEDLNSLSKGFNAMVGHISQLINKMIQQEKENANARYLALQAQINPHFLYNTLDTIRGIALKNGVESIANITKSMSQIFRYSINNNKLEVSLWEEFQYVFNYISIQKYRYKDRLSIDFDLDEDLLSNKTIRLIVQPLVENAICHGLELKEGSGQIKVCCKEKDSKIIISVKDNGVGIPREKLQEIHQILQQPKAQSFSNIGLYNVHQRLILYYGDEYGIQIESVLGEGTEVSLSLPITQKKKTY